MSTLRILTSRYFRLQQQKGRNLITAVILFIPIALKHLPKIIKYVVVFRFRNGGKNVNTGYGLYDRPLLISYPRSGTNWVRYIIESLSGRPTPGQARLHTGTDYFIDRAHKAYPVAHRHPGVILILRDYRECLLRSNTGLWEEHRDVELFLEDRMTLSPPHWYIDNLTAYDTYDGKKLLVFYEDLIGHPEREIRRISSFLDLDPDETDAFLANLDEHKRTSLSLFTAGGHTSETRGDSSKASHHADMQITCEQRAAFDRYYMENQTTLFERYLSRYIT